jgi:hypothetical protein
VPRTQAEKLEAIKAQVAAGTLTKRQATPAEHVAWAKTGANHGASAG